MTKSSFLSVFTAFSTLILPLTAHNGTAEWEKNTRETSDTYRSALKNDNIPFIWSPDHKFLFAKITSEQNQDEWWQYDLENGDHVVVEKPPQDVKKNGKSAEKSVPPKPSRPWEVEVKKRKITFKNKEKSQSAPDFLLPEGSYWTGQQTWSPDGSAVVLWHSTSKPVRLVHYVDSSPKDQVQPKHFTVKYPKAGDDLNIAQPVIFFTDGRPPLALDKALAPTPFEIRNARWSGDSTRLTVEYIERGFGKYQILEIDTKSSKQRVLVSEESDKFVFVFGNAYRYDLTKSNEILWLSERSGYNHLYLIDSLTGEVKKQLTSGDWVVRGVVNVNEEKRQALIKISGKNPVQDPYYIHFARLNLDSGEMTMLTDADGTHRLFFSPDGQHYVDQWSRIDHPPVFEIRQFSDGKKIATLPESNTAALVKTGWQSPEPFVAKDRNDKYDIFGVIYRPRNFDPAKKYPVIEKIYAGPQSSYAPKAWSTWNGTASEMTEAGFIVVELDGLGTNNRGREFQQVAYKNLIDSGFPDRIKWMKAAAAKYPEMDLTRVGIYGGSAGGQSALAALLTHPEFYKSAAADCGCHDNRMDKIWWNEQWMDWPVDDSYVQNSNLTHIKNLQGALMLTVGELDTNVDPSSTMQVINALIKNDKDFEYFIIPGANHGIGEGSYLRRKRIEFFQKNLQ